MSGLKLTRLTSSFSEAKTAAPANLDDHELSDNFTSSPRDLSEVSNVSQCVILLHYHSVSSPRARNSPPILRLSSLISMKRLGDLNREFVGAFFQSDDIDEQYRIALDFDARLLQLLDFCPDLKPHPEPYPRYIEVESFSYVPWSRHLWATLLPATRIMFLRPFLRLSFAETRFFPARQVRAVLSPIRTSLKADHPTFLCVYPDLC